MADQHGGAAHQPFLQEKHPPHLWNVGKESSEQKALNSRTLALEKLIFPCKLAANPGPCHGKAQGQTHPCNAKGALLLASVRHEHRPTFPNPACATGWQHRIPYRENSFLPSVQPVLIAAAGEAIPEPLGDIWTLQLNLVVKRLHLVDLFSLLL